MPCTVCVSRAACGVPTVIVASLPGNRQEQVAAPLLRMGINPLCGMSEAPAAAALGARSRRVPAPAGPVLLPLPALDPTILAEAEAKAAMAAFGVRVTPSERAASPSAEAEAAGRIGFPVVLKGEGVVHKTEAGPVF